MISGGGLQITKCILLGAHSIISDSDGHGTTDDKVLVFELIELNHFLQLLERSAFTSAPPQLYTQSENKICFMLAKQSKGLCRKISSITISKAWNIHAHQGIMSFYFSGGDSKMHVGLTVFGDSMYPGAFLFDCRHDRIVRRDQHFTLQCFLCQSITDLLCFYISPSN